MCMVYINEFKRLARCFGLYHSYLCMCLCCKTNFSSQLYRTLCSFFNIFFFRNAVFGVIVACAFLRANIVVYILTISLILLLLLRCVFTSCCWLWLQSPLHSFIVIVVVVVLVIFSLPCTWRYNPPSNLLLNWWNKFSDTLSFLN